MKRWYSGIVERVVYDSRGEVVKRNKQVAQVYAYEGQVAALLCRRCPDPWPGQDMGEVKTRVRFQPVRGEEGL